MFGVIVPLYFIKTLRGTRDWLWEKKIFYKELKKINEFCEKNKWINEIVFIASWEANVVLCEKFLFLEVICKCNVLYCSQTRT